MYVLMCVHLIWRIIMLENMNSYITTYSKIHFTPISPKANDIKIEDIGHALSLMCRANGHFKKFFSVAQHSINCAIEAKARGYSKRLQLSCLLHDASEAYISDITRPIKKHLPQYIEFEDRLQNEIWNKYLIEPLTDEEKRQVFEIDDSMLYYEFLHFMGEQVLNYTPNIKVIPNFDFKAFDIAEKQFISIFKSLMSKERDFLCVGVDGYKGEWLAVAISTDTFEVAKFKTIDEICRKYNNADSLLIDIPIGLPENKVEAKKRPDNELRTLLAKKSSSVFNTPFRQIVYADDTKQAWELNRELEAKQNPISMALCKSIKQVDVFLQRNPVWKNKLIESHPEYGFYLLNQCVPLNDSKLDGVGLQSRIDILKIYYPDTQTVIDVFLKQNKFRKKIDDVLDALCLAVVGKLGCENGFETIPNIPFQDGTGLKMQIIIYKK